MSSCTALKEIYVPSIFELQECCKSDQHTMCPYYSNRDAEPDTGLWRSTKYRTVIKVEKNKCCTKC